jgi:hypothetical protein
LKATGRSGATRPGNIDPILRKLLFVYDLSKSDKKATNTQGLYCFEALSCLNLTEASH